MRPASCPAPHLISAYLDGELEERWTGELERHLESCATCRGRLISLQHVSHSLLEDIEPDVRGATHVVWRRLELERRETVRPRFWRRLIRVPVPLVAAAAAAVILLGGALIARIGDFRLMQLTTSPTGATEVKLAAPIEEIERIIEGLNAERSNPVFIDLPVDSRFHMAGQPAILRQDELRSALP